MKGKEHKESFQAGSELRIPAPKPSAEIQPGAGSSEFPLLKAMASLADKAETFFLYFFNEERMCLCVREELSAVFVRLFVERCRFLMTLCCLCFPFASPSSSGHFPQKR